MDWDIKNEEIIGYVLLVAGVLLILFSLYEVIQVFTGASPPPDLFNFSDIAFSSPLSDESSTIISGKDLNTLFGMGVWYMLMFFVMWAGGKLSSLGVNLLREIRVEVKGNIHETEKSQKTADELEV
ncbi:MAG: hypothetical protein ACOC6H_03505 [Thermoproteota archaeon]